MARTGSSSGSSDEDAKKVEDEKRQQVRKQTRIAVMKKAFAVLVALSWSQALTFGDDPEPETWWWRLLLSLCVYAGVWAGAYVFSLVCLDEAFEWFTLFAAELTAFLWRDAASALRGFIYSKLGAFQVEEGAEAAEAHETGEGRADWKLATLLRRLADIAETAIGEDTNGGREASANEQAVADLFFAMFILVVGIASILVMKNVRLHCARAAEDPATDSEESEAKERFERIDDCMADVDADAVGLATGFALMTALTRWMFGAEWEEVLEEGSDSSFSLYFLFFTLSNVLCAVILKVVTMCGLRWHSAPVEAISGAFGSFSGFLLHAFFWKTVAKGWLGAPENGLSWQLIEYPFLILLFGILVVSSNSEKKTRLLGLIPGCNPASVENWQKVFVFAWMLAMALAFEKLFENILEAMHEESTKSRFALASMLTFLYVVSEVIFQRMGRAEEKEEGSDNSDGAAE